MRSFFLRKQKKRSATERAKDALHSSEIGHTADLWERLKKHNKGDVPHTAKFRPWKVETYIAFESEEKSIAFEHYLKSGSGERI